MLFGTALVMMRQCLAEGGTGSEPAEGAGHAVAPTVLVGVAIILILAKLGGERFERFKQPAVLGELVGRNRRWQSGARRSEGRRVFEDQRGDRRTGGDRRDYPAL